MSPSRALAALTCAAALATTGAARAAGLLEGNHPLVEEGTRAYENGDYEGALRAYEGARRELPRSAELDYDLGDVYMKLGRADDAKRSFEAALSKAGDSLKPRDYFNLGNALVKLGQREDAIAAYRQALKLDPGFEAARHNLEVLLLDKSSKPNSPSAGDGGTPDGGSAAGKDAGSSNDGGTGGDSRDAGADGGGADASPDGGQGDGGSSGDAGTGEGADGGPRPEEPSHPRDGATLDGGSQDGGTMSQAEPSKPVDRQEAERLLDALRRNEKQFLMQQHQQKVKQRARPEKDW